MLHSPSLLVLQQLKSQLCFVAIISFATASLSLQITLRIFIAAIIDFDPMMRLTNVKPKPARDYGNLLAFVFGIANTSHSKFYMGILVS